MIGLSGEIPLVSHSDVTSPFPPSGNGGYASNRDVTKPNVGHKSHSVQSESMHATDFPNYVIWVFFLFFLRSSKGYVPAQLFCILALSVYQANNMFVRHESPQVPH